MANVASWIRECDGRYFRQFFDAHPEVKLFNARVEPVDWAAMDGLLLTGGADISTQFLNQEIPEPSLIEEPEPTRDAWEFETLRLALQAGKPVFAICKGHQVLNVALGGTLHLDIPGHNQTGDEMAGAQPMRYAAGARHRLERVNSSHHQAIDKPGEGLEIEGWCATDGVIEQVNLRDYPFGLGVQYHPERDSIYERLFADFFDHVLKK